MTNEKLQGETLSIVLDLKTHTYALASDDLGQVSGELNILKRFITLQQGLIDGFGELYHNATNANEVDLETLLYLVQSKIQHQALDDRMRRHTHGDSE